MKRWLASIVLVSLVACAGSSPSSPGGAGAAGTTGGAGSGPAGATTGPAGAAGGAAGAPSAGGAGGAVGAAGAAGAGSAGAAAGGAAGTTGAWRCPAGTFTAPALAGLTPQRLAGVPPDETFAPGFSIIEGPAWIGDTLYVSQFGSASRPPTSRLISLAPAAPSVVVDADFGSNGLAVDPQGNLVVASHKDGAILRVSPASPAARTTIASQYMGKRFNAPNDVTVRSDGTIYFSDPDAYQSPTPAPQARPRVYRVSPAGVVSVVDETISEPNGVTLSLDEKTLYVDGDAGLFKLAVAPDGSTGAKTPFGNSPAYTGSDGMALDCAGDLYVVHGATISVLDPTGTELGHLALTGAQAATNLAFGGADHKTLFITTLDAKPGVYSVTLGVPGMPF